jgi:serine/threonine protein kinase/HEAT repeat protein
MTTESGRHSNPSNPSNEALLNTGPKEPGPRPAGSTGTTLPGTGYAPLDAQGDDFIGKELSSYRVISKLGQGGMGMVYLAQHAMIGRKAAVKVLKRELCKDQDVVERFYQEGKAVGQLRHENIIDVYDFGKENDQVYFVMELLEGETLTARIKRGAIPFAEAYALILQIAEALKAAHEKGIVHRDIKPDNIFLLPKPGGPPKIKVLDFGLAKLTGNDQKERLTQNGSIMGTPHYMSPQQIDGASVDGRADIYALGAVIYEMFTGEPPFKGTTVGELLKGHLFTPPPPLRAEPTLQVPSMMGRVVAKALEKRLDTRYQSAQELIDDVKKATTDTKMVPRPGTEAPQGPKAWVLALAGGGVAAIAAAAFLWLNPGETKPQEPASVPITSAPTAAKSDSKALRELALAALRAALKEREAEVRAESARGVGKIQDRGSLEPLTTLLSDEDTNVKKSAAFALAELNDSRAITGLEELKAKTEDPSLLRALDQALFRLGSEEAEKRLLAALKAKETEARLEAALTLASKGVYDAEDPLKALLASSDEATQRRVTEVLDSLLRLGDEEAESKLIALLDSPDEPIRLAAAEVLANVGDERGKETAQKTLSDHSSVYRVSAARVLVLLGDYSQTQLFSAALKADEPKLQKEGIEGLALVGEQTALPELAAFLSPEQRPLTRIAAAVAILEIVGLSQELLAQNSQEALSNALASADEKTRANAASALGSGTGADALPLLQKAAQDESAIVRKEAISSLGRIGSKEAIATLSKAVQDKDNEVSKAAVDALGKMNGDEAKDALKQAKDGEASIIAAGELAARGETDSIALIEKSAKDKDAKTRSAAVKAAAKAQRTDILTKALKDKDANVRFEAALALAKSGNKEGLSVLEEGAKSKNSATSFEAKNAMIGLGELPPEEGSAWPTRANEDAKKKLVASTKNYEPAVAKKLLSRALHDASPDVQLAALSAVQDIEAKDPEGAKKLYRAALREKDPTVKNAAKAALARLEAEGPKQPNNATAANNNTPNNTTPDNTPPPSTEEQKAQEFQLHMTLASTATSTGKYAEAINRFKKAQAIKPELRIYFELGEAYRKWGDQSNTDEKRQLERWKLAKTNYEKFKKGGGKGPNLTLTEKALIDLNTKINSQ